MRNWNGCPNTEALDRFEMKQLREEQEETYSYYYDDVLDDQLDLIEQARFADQAREFIKEIKLAINTHKNKVDNI